MGGKVYQWAIDVEPPVTDEVLLLEKGPVGTEKAVPWWIPCQYTVSEIQKTTNKIAFHYDVAWDTYSAPPGRPLRKCGTTDNQTPDPHSNLCQTIF